MNGEKVGDPIDLYHPVGVIHSGTIEVGVVELKAGEQIVEIEILGRNDAAVPLFMVGVDRVMFVP